jgi:transposase-like protein
MKFPAASINFFPRCTLFMVTPRQRCLVHKQRNVLNAIPHREHQEVTTELVGIWKQEKKEDALINLAAFKAKYSQRYPEAMRRLSEDEAHLSTFYAYCRLKDLLTVSMRLPGNLIAHRSRLPMGAR